ncbi:AI-2E family transporter [Clostridia bacterium]|nr:AI-2E family transporter [Clostridia bacterium]
MPNENRPQGANTKTNWDIKPYLAIGLTAVLVVIFCMVCFFLIFRYKELQDVTHRILEILQPIIFGLVFAYLINPIVVFLEKKISPLFGKSKKNVQVSKPTGKEGKQGTAESVSTEKGQGAAELYPVAKKNYARGISVVVAMVFVLLLITLLFVQVIPQLYASVEKLVRQLPEQRIAFLAWFDDFSRVNNEQYQYIASAVNTATEYITTWAKEVFLPQSGTFLTSLTSGVLSVVIVLMDLLIGLILAICLLLNKERLIGESKKLIYAIFPVRPANVFVKTLRKSNEIMSGYITGMIVNSVIVGIICYIIVRILHLPYAALVSVIMGVTNMIPFFGLLLGGIPTVFLIALVSPLQGLQFAIVVLVLREADSYLIKPKVLGDATGLSAFWIIVSTLVAGGLFGVTGMLLGVPVFAVIYYMVKKLVEYVLKKRKLPTATKEYTQVIKVEQDTGRLCYKESNKP